jgi:apolipoprotein N-acyltransferase
MLACSGIISPGAYRDLASQGASMLINSASLGIFRASPQYYDQSVQFARLQSSSNARPMVQAARNGPSFVLSSSGDVIDYLPRETSMKLKSYDLYAPSAKTPYTIIGEWVLWLIVASGVGIIFYNLYRRYRKK